MYAIDLMFDLAELAVGPSREILSESIRRACGGDGEVVHLFVSRKPGSLRVIVFVTARSFAEAESLGRQAGRAAVDAVTSIALGSVRVWRPQDGGTAGVS